MHIGIKTITGIGIAAILSLGASIPAHAATDTPTTQNLSTTQVQFRYTDIGAYDVSFTWNAGAMKVNGDNNTWCDVMLWAKNPLIPGYDNGEDTFAWNTNTYHFGATTDSDGSQELSVAPGGTFRVQLLCHNSSDTTNYSYTSDWFTAKDVPTAAPSKPDTNVYYGTDILAYLSGATPAGQAQADTCLFRLYKNGALTKTVSNTCPGGGSYYFANLTPGTYQVQEATRNSAGTSDWSPLSDKVTIKAGTSNTNFTPISATKAPSTVSTSYGIRGTQLHLTWGKANTNKGAAIKQYKVTIIKGKATTYRHTFTPTKRALTKTLKHGTYTVKITAVNKAGKQTTTSNKIKL